MFRFLRTIDDDGIVYVITELLTLMIGMLYEDKDENYFNDFNDDNHY